MHKIAGQHHLCGLRHTEHSRVEPDAAVTGEQADLYVGRREAGVRGSDPDVAGALRGEVKRQAYGLELIASETAATALSFRLMASISDAPRFEVMTITVLRKSTVRP